LTVEFDGEWCIEIYQVLFLVSKLLKSERKTIFLSNINVPVLYEDM